MKPEQIANLLHHLIWCYKNGIITIDEYLDEFEFIIYPAVYHATRK